ncbi:aldo/keto reductase [uncultured Pseudokineococcus sp.]|uniref:aldo/keto reductase n=1 Tax=uncultured Pseudokineococcus sp. TaxID=1642928 RepID=UPI00262A34DA|nr:aldo/keto reductase [uncultured Pseudokineococcus sp.]
MTDSTPSTQTPDARRSGVFEIPGVGPVHRLGYGAMRITGPGIWGEPADRGTARDVVRRAVELGVDFIDTADSYGPEVSEQILREALHPYPEGLVIATKAGLTRTGPDQWHPVGRPEYLRQQCELSLRRLGVEAIDLFQLHRIDPQVDRDDQLGLLRDLLDEGKVRAVGLSQVSVEDIRAASSIVDVATVQNRFNLTDRTDADVLEHCAEEGIGFIPWAPVSAGELARPGGPVDEVAQRTGASASQVALAWLLRLSPVILPIPGTGSVGHLEDNLGAAGLELSEQDMSSLTGAA